jgi:glutaconate CoA-transferase subunit A
MKMGQNQPGSSSKVMSAREAVERFVPDGASVSLANFLTAIPFALVHELIRQRKKGLTVWSQSGIEEIDLLAGAGCVQKVITAYNYRAGGEWAGTEFERAVKEKRIEVEDLSNFTVLAMLWAGALGYSFMPVLKGIKETDVFRLRTLLGGDKFKVVNCPFTGEEVVVVKGVQPDVALIHVQRCDAEGNAQYWGSIGNSKWAALACKHIIVSCEEVVEHDIIQFSPHLTLIPSFRVDAVVEEPWGAHPAEVLGYYNFDLNFRAGFYVQNALPGGIQQFIKEWIYDCADRKEYLNHYMQKYGSDRLLRQRARHHPSYPADYGSANLVVWDEKGNCEELGVTRSEFDKIIESQGEVIEWEIEEK